ncbi:propionate catabolism operon regulatory protein PrpR [Diaphorobacter aerolatus]|uniref:Propionate catabolism operon regulatory protein PrpR n=1 Tax=Diaphorobacter aerolatus TaxID=1288495 RepID=A0A7H0GHV3_9BURK|nr:propionate catabolism operon regulatory protein PrpR [Diaphorobacter aerolatus]QNP47869.1 propionate catabolism operon regulatory protein PrpR [Diaphorobacter aerolatus]
MPSVPATPTRLPRLCFVSYRQIREFAMPVIAEYADRARIDVVDGTFGQALSVAQSRIDHDEVDVFVSAGSNASILRAGLQLPVATIQLSGFDLFQALIRARRIAPRVGVVMYGHTIPELEAVKELLNIEISQHAYRTPEDARQRFDALRREGFEVIVGSSLVVDLAQQAGLHGLLAYSLDSVRKGFDDALELARVARLEASRYEQLHSVLHNLQEAVVAVDQQERIITANPAMQQLLAGPGVRLDGRVLSDLAPEFSLRATLKSGQIDRAVAIRFAQRDWVAHRTPMVEQGSIVGAALTLNDARTIQAADTSLRILQRRQQHAARHTFESLVGTSAALEQAKSSARRFAPTDLNVLITGESGTGKELFAQAMHNASARTGKPFVAVNCASFPETLLESELFGYEEGAFTGSRRGGKPGLIEAAHTGTLFLDEIGDMPLPLQTRLLRVLQEREIMRLGATAPIPIDVRVIAATHQPLATLIQEQRFRQDLYYRLNTLRLALPALRERPEDIPAIITPLVTRCLARLGSSLPAEPALASIMDRIAAHDWPGNVRELENIAERIAVFLLPFARVEDIRFDGLRSDCPELFGEHEDDARDTPLAQRIREAMESSGGRPGLAAKKLGVSRSTLWRWLQSPPDEPLVANAMGMRTGPKPR